jgi:hypothetical protein
MRIVLSNCTMANVVAIDAGPPLLPLFGMRHSVPLMG